MRNSVLFFIIIALLLGGYVFYSQKNKPLEVVNQLPTKPTQKVVLPSINVAIPENWVPFSSEKYGFSIRFPLDVKYETMQEGERFYKLGPTQSDGTELYDGISIMIKSGELNDLSLENFVKKRHTELKNDPLNPTVGEIKKVTIAGLSGYSFRFSSIGEATFIYLPKGKDEYLEVVDGTVEPTNREQTFRKTVDTMFSTIKTSTGE